MRKQLLVSLLCCLLVSAASLAQSWKPYEQAAKGKTYEASDCVTLLDRHRYLSSLQDKGRLLYAK